MKSNTNHRRNLFLVLIVSIVLCAFLGATSAFAAQDQSSGEEDAAVTQHQEDSAAVSTDASEPAGTAESKSEAASTADSEKADEKDKAAGKDADEADTSSAHDAVATNTAVKPSASKKDGGKKSSARTGKDSSAKFEPKADDDVVKDGTLNITGVAVNSWDGDDRLFECWVELGDLESYGPLGLTITGKDGSASSYTLNPDSDEKENIDRVTNKTVENGLHKSVYYAFLIGDGEKISITGIPQGTHYQCYMASSGGVDYGTGYNDKYTNVYSSTMSATSGAFFGEGVTFNCTATFSRYSRVVPTVKVLLNASDATVKFPFRLTLLEEDNKTPITGYRVDRGGSLNLVTDGSGQVEFELASNQSAALFIPAHANYKVEELELDADRYSLYETPEKASDYVENLNSQTLLFFNIEKYKIPIEKQDEGGHLIPGAKMQVLDDQGKVVKEWTSEEGKTAEVWLDMTTGNASYGIPSSYVLHEAEPPAGYTAADDISFKVTASSNSAPQITLDDDTNLEKLVMVDKELPREISVTKSWNDDDDSAGKRPGKVQVQLVADGEPYGDPVVLDESGDWSYTWENLAWHKDGKEIAYGVQEIDLPEGYTATVEGDADEGFTITNTFSEQEEKTNPAPTSNDKANEGTPKASASKVQTKASKLPKAGDGAHDMVFGLCALCLAGAACGAMAIRRRRSPRR